ncbi:hypothetical protein AMK68_05440 [candidate division KD3-62 bacterium DG_56]|uniref:Uncharacterized protein n=1 Tax=candidate division KD3-62 bacterium DG_56 TaxID=1704032 RepID=A0A0S7XHS0_9BACT|nr:MAG: hypothetical protein AMK68_05440 [candidate division KD3-62 bacterium DG_56]
MSPSIVQVKIAIQGALDSTVNVGQTLVWPSEIATRQSDRNRSQGSQVGRSHTASIHSPGG